MHNEIKNTIQKARADARNRIFNSFSNSDEIEKADEDELMKGHNVGDVHPNGKWVWTQIPSGKFDWRGIKGGQQTPAPETKPTAANQTKIEVYKMVTGVKVAGGGIWQMAGKTSSGAFADSSKKVAMPNNQDIEDAIEIFQEHLDKSGNDGYQKREIKQTSERFSREIGYKSKKSQPKAQTSDDIKKEYEKDNSLANFIKLEAALIKEGKLKLTVPQENLRKELIQYKRKVTTINMHHASGGDFVWSDNNSAVGYKTFQHYIHYGVLNGVKAEAPKEFYATPHGSGYTQAQLDAYEAKKAAMKATPSKPSATATQTPAKPTPTKAPVSKAVWMMDRDERKELNAHFEKRNYDTGREGYQYYVTTVKEGQNHVPVVAASFSSKKGHIVEAVKKAYNRSLGSAPKGYSVDTSKVYSPWAQKFVSLAELIKDEKEKGYDEWSGYQSNEFEGEVKFKITKD